MDPFSEGLKKPEFHDGGSYKAGRAQRGDGIIVAPFQGLGSLSRRNAMELKEDGAIRMEPFQGMGERGGGFP